MKSTKDRSIDPSLREYFAASPRREPPPKARIGQEIFAFRAEDLTGPLNDIEKVYAPKEIFAAGPMETPLPKPRVAIVGSRKASSEGLETAAKVARTLAKRGAIIVSGLAEGIDTAAHAAALDAGGRTIAVLGTPLDRVYPSMNSGLQDQIRRNHLVISQFPIGYPVRPKNFVIRNRTMALISNASIIIEAGETSGSLHQGWEALRLGRPLFIWKTILENGALNWPEKMLRYGAIELDDPEHVVDVLPSPKRVIKITA